MAFPEDPLDLRGELTIDGTRVDVTKHLYTRDPIEITAGMSAQGTGVDPSTCSLTLNNKDGRYSPRNPLSPYFGKLPRNTPLTVSVKGPESYLRLEGNTASYARTPDTGVLDITGDIDIRVEATVDWYATEARALIGKYIVAGNQRSYSLQLSAGGLLTLWWSTNGSATFFAQQALPLLPRRAALRATLDVNNGSGGFTATLYWAESLDGPWAQIGDPLSAAGVTSIYNSSAPLEIAPPGIPAASPVRGRVHRAEVRNGIGGTVVASPDLRGLAEGTTSWDDSAGRAWTVGALAAVSDREYLFSGEVASWPAKWDASGRDAWVPIEGAGVLRRLGQNRHPVQSTLRRRIPSDPRLIAYWPMEDGEDAAAAYSPLTGVQPLTMSGWDFAANDSLGGSAPLPKATSTATLRGTVPRAAAPGWQVEFVFFLPAMPVPQTEILRISVAGSVISTVVVSASTSGVRVGAEDAQGDTLASFLYSDAGAIADFWGKWNRLAIYTVQDGATVRIYFRWRDITTNGSWVARTSLTGTQGTVTALSGAWGANTTDMVMGHLAVFDVPAQSTDLAAPPGSLIFEGADDGYARETALARLARLSAEEAALVDLSWVGEDYTAASERMGPQRLDTVLNLFRQAAETDGGILFERTDRLGLVYRERASLYNQKPTLTLDYADGHLAPPLEPVDDDSVLANDVTVQRAGGSEAKVVIEEGPNSVLPSEEGGVGIYEESVTLSLAYDSQPYQIAGWMAHLGTWDEPRYPTVTVRLHRHPELIPAVLRLRIGDMLRIVNPPIWAGPGPVELHVLQIKHRPLPRTWQVEFVCVPAGPWRTGVVDDPVLGRVDTDGSELNTGVSATATSWPVAVTAGPLWITTALHPTEFPFDVICGGEVATVTGISGTSSPQTFTVTRSVNGVSKAHTAGADVRLAVPTIAAL
ncbi:hypothetical protein ACIOG7_10320 [Streptomyces sp. NPDC087894]|uniref:hypothetical protein n=1 Tax=Streptomyces sp. NPDC087894 TaxID=3365816 RepID=UPI00381DBD7C